MLRDEAAHLFLLEEWLMTPPKIRSPANGEPELR
jgi:hypothetical protein